MDKDKLIDTYVAQTIILANQMIDSSLEKGHLSFTMGGTLAGIEPNSSEALERYLFVCHLGPELAVHFKERYDIDVLINYREYYLTFDLSRAVDNFMKKGGEEIK